MPFPVVDHKRYIKLAANIGLFLVLPIFMSSGSTPTTTTPSLLVFDSGISEIYSHSSLQAWLVSDTLNTEYKS